MVTRRGFVAIVGAFFLLSLPAGLAEAKGKGKTIKPAAFIGKWKIQAVTTRKGPVPKDKVLATNLVWHFRSNKTMSISVGAGAQTKTSNGTWSRKGSTVTVDENGAKQSMTFKRSGKKLTLTSPKGSPKLTFKLIGN